jgi:hypothetical protein
MSAIIAGPLIGKERIAFAVIGAIVRIHLNKIGLVERA